MTLSTSFMKRSLLAASITSICALSSQAFAEETKFKKNYQEPTRGFFLEHGTVSGLGKASVELYTGSDELFPGGSQNGGAIRLGLNKAELILNSGTNGYDKNEALLKWSLPRQSDDGKESTPFIWSLLAGIGHMDIETDAGDLTQTSLTLGVAATLKADAGTFTVTPKLVYADSEVGNAEYDDTFFELDLGAYVGLIETGVGLFSAGAEALITTADDKDNTFALGARWLYNEQINLDIVPIVFSDADLVGVPGLVRLNVAF